MPELGKIRAGNKHMPEWKFCISVLFKEKCAYYDKKLLRFHFVSDELTSVQFGYRSPLEILIE